MTVAVLRLVCFLAFVAGLGASGYTFFDRAWTGDLNPAREIDEAAARGELMSARYVLGIVAGQLAQVNVLSGSYAGTLQFDEFPPVTRARRRVLLLRRVREDSHVQARRPGRHCRAG